MTILWVTSLWQSRKFMTAKVPDSCNINNVEIAVPLKYLSNFWRTFEILLSNSILLSL